MNSKYFEKAYDTLSHLTNQTRYHLVPVFRRILRFLALPYCYSNVNWELCSRSRVGVWVDFLYIFFVLKYYPDNYSPCRLWEKPRYEWKFYYGSNYDPYQRKKLQRNVQPPEYEIVFKDKWITDVLCRDAKIPMPPILGKIKPGEPIGERLRQLMSADHTALIAKPLDGKGGGGVIYSEQTEFGITYLKGQNQINLDSEPANGELIVQGFIRQHSELTRISTSTNTVRIVTLLKPDQSVLIIGSYMRFGTGKSKVDNLSQGGLCVRIDPQNGRLEGPGSDRRSHKYEKHPDSQVNFSGTEIPYWEQVKDLAIRIQKYFNFYQLLGMDIAISDKGPVLIEINSSYDNVDLEQAAGPILKSETVQKAYSEMGLLINRKQHELHHGTR